MEKYSAIKDMYYGNRGGHDTIKIKKEELLVLDVINESEELLLKNLSQTPDLLEVLDTGIHSIPNARGGRRLTSEKYSKMVRPKTATSIPLRRDSSGHSSESSTFKANHDAERRRPRISVAFGAITMPNAPSSDRRVITD